MEEKAQTLGGSITRRYTGKKEENDPHIRWTLIGLEDQLWGKAVALVGQIGMICCFKDALSSTDTAMLHALGPNRGLAFPQGEDHQEVLDSTFSGH